MASVEKVENILKMFDKVDDIIYEPVKLMCDAMRQPLKQIDLNNEKTMAKHQQDLEMQIKEFETNLELSKKKREMEMDIDRRRLEEEIVQMISENDLKRREEMVQMEMRYRKEMAEAAARLEQIMANMQVETRKKIFDLYTEKIKNYLDSQHKYQDKLDERVEKMKKLFPGEKGLERIFDYYMTEVEIINHRSTSFTNSMEEDMTKVLGIIDDGMKEMTGLATKYFKPADPNQEALIQNITDEIEHRE